MKSPPGAEGLSPRLAELAKPVVRSLPPAKQAKALSLAPEGPGSLLRRGNRVLVDVRFEEGAAAGVEALREAGAQIVNVSRKYQTVTVAAKPDELRAVAGVARVEVVTPSLAPIVAASTCPSGAVVSEGVEQLNVLEARTNGSVNGSGVTVGVLSDSYNKATEAADGSGPIATKAGKDVETGDLPGVGNTCVGETVPIDVLEDIPSAEAEEATDEGRAMLQIVHDVAPDASLAFATAFPNEEAFAENIERLASTGLGGGKAKVIVDDVSYLGEPFFQDGPVAAAVKKVTEQGVTYFSAAGNDNLFDSEGHEIASWEAPSFRDSGSCPPAVSGLAGANGTNCLDFNPGTQVDKTYGMKVPPGVALTVDLQWNEPWNGVGTDLDAFLLNSEGALIAVAGEDNVKLQIPAEILQWTNESSSQKTVQLVVNRFSGGNPRLKFVFAGDGVGPSAVEYPTSSGGDVVGPTVFGHAGAASAIGVGAVPFFTKEEPEEYSSRGPVTHYFGPVEGTAKALPLSEPEIVSTPVLAATDCVKTTFFAFQVGGTWHFCGTSAAAPHAAGVAALMKQKEPAAEPEGIRSALLDSATPVGSFGACAVGAGLVEALGAVEDVLAPAPPTPLDCQPPESPGNGENAQAPGNWGSESPPTPPASNSTPAPTPTPVAPKTSLLKHPQKVVRTRGKTARVIFRFGSDQAGATFFCRIDKGRFRSCPARFVRRFKIGKHVLQVQAVDAAGLADPTPVVFHFRVKRVG